MARGTKDIYVQIDISAPIERIWQLTQTPELHRQWDLRFSDIEYLPRPDDAQPQRFLYVTRIGLGLAVRGKGETAGTCHGSSGQSTSALKFWSDDPKSLIRKGSGYWKYIPQPGSAPSVRFITRYGYEVRFGLAGRIIDRLVFRPLLGWATAWSFDRLRRWIENGAEPHLSAQRMCMHFIARATVGFVWFYHGLVPKLLFPREELTFLQAAGFSPLRASRACTIIGLGEIVLGVVLMFVGKPRWTLWLTLLLMPAAAMGAAITSPRLLVAAFNPITLNLCVFVLAVIALLTARDLPSARSCIRRPLEGE